MATLQLGHPYLFVLAAVVSTFWLVQLFALRPPFLMQFPLTGAILREGQGAGFAPWKTLKFLRALIGCLLLILIGQPQWVEHRARVTINGVDIAMTLDVSGSMRLIDNPQTRETRLQVALREAEAFIKKRQDDAVSLVIFAVNALTLAPLTHDKVLLSQLLSQVTLGSVLDERGTFLATGIATALNRLKHSTAKSKIVVLLTDGRPESGQGEAMSIPKSLELARALGCRIYTIGIGSESGVTYDLFNGRLIQVSEMGCGVDDELLTSIAQQTGGRYFRARNAQELARIYDQINQLETDERELERQSEFHEAATWLIWLVAALVLLELLLRAWWWRGLA